MYLSLVVADRLRLILLVGVLLAVICVSGAVGFAYWRQSFSQLQAEARRAAGPDVKTLGCYEQFASTRTAGGSGGGTMRCFFEAPGEWSVRRAGKINEVKGSMAPIRPDDTDVVFNDGRHWVTISYSTTVAGDVVYGHRLDGGQTLIVVTVENAAPRPPR
jgi:hypothetical protein